MSPNMGKKAQNWHGNWFIHRKITNSYTVHYKNSLIDALRLPFNNSVIFQVVFLLPSKVIRGLKLVEVTIVSPPIITTVPKCLHGGAASFAFPYTKYVVFSLWPSLLYMLARFRCAIGIFPLLDTLLACKIKTTAFFLSACFGIPPWMKQADVFICCNKPQHT